MKNEWKPNVEFKALKKYGLVSLSYSMYHLMLCNICQRTLRKYCRQQHDPASQTEFHTQ